MKQLLDVDRLAQLRDIIDNAKRIVVTCHVGPDGDAIGSILATTHVMTRLGKTVTPVVPNAFPAFLSWAPGVSEILVTEKNEVEVQSVIDAADLIIYQDFNEEKRMDLLAPMVAKNTTAKRLMIDHHLDPKADCTMTISYPEMSATCELLFRLFSDLGLYETMTHDEAVCLYLGMMTDTGAFTYNSARPEVYMIIGELLAKGIDKDKIYRNVFYSWSKNRFKLMGYLLYVNWMYLDEYHTSIISLDRQERKRFGYTKGDTEGIVNMPLQIAGTRLSVFLREDTEQKDIIKVSLRSVDDVPCNVICSECFNGGGHKNASGGELHMPMDQAIEYVKLSIKKYKHLL